MHILQPVSKRLDVRDNDHHLITALHQMDIKYHCWTQDYIAINLENSTHWGQYVEGLQKVIYKFSNRTQYWLTRNQY